ncbi:carbon storage regulator [compost metagenome]
MRHLHWHPDAFDGVGECVLSLTLSAYTLLNPSWEVIGYAESRRAGQSIVLSLAPGADPENAWRQFLRDGITVMISQIESGNVRVSIDAPRTIQILRNELIHP